MRKRLLIFLCCCLLAFVLAAGCASITTVTENSPPTSTLPETSPEPSPTEAATPVSSSSLSSAASTASTAAATTTAEVTTATLPAETTTEATTTATEATTTKATTRATTRQTARPTPSPTPVNKSPYYLYAEKGSFTLVAYAKDKSGKYTKVVRVMRMAIGRGTMTPSGKFSIGQKIRWKNFSGIYGQYASQYKSGLYIHGPCYDEKDNTTMIESYYTGIGTKSTSGCLRLTTADAYWVYSNCPAGTTLEIVSGSPRGFTAPALIPIVIAGQDPTDPNLKPPPPTPTPTEATTEATTAATTATEETTAAETTTAEVTTAEPISAAG